MQNYSNIRGVYELKSKLKTLWELFFTFFKIGAFTFGGGYAMISIIQKEAVENKKWVSDEDILDVVAIAESTPGPIAINSSTFIGYKVMGVLGSFFATLGTVLPSFIIISIIAYFLGKFNEYTVVKYAFNGIRAGVFVLIINAFISMYKKSPKGAIAWAIMAFSFLGVVLFDFPVIAVLLACAVIGLITDFIAKKEGK